MKQEDFEEWYESAPAEYFKKYLNDSINEKIEDASDALRYGGILSESEQVHIAVECATLTRIIDVTYDEIKEFYDLEEG